MRAVLFDFGGTLDSDGLTWGQRFYPLYREAGLAPSREAFDKAFYKSDDNLPKRFKLKGLDLKKTLELQVGCVIEDLAPERTDLIPKIAGRFLADCRRFFDRNRPLLDRLKKRYKLGVVSNFYGNLDAILRAEGLEAYFDVVADSEVIGHTKPSKEIFEHAFKALGLEAGDCVMVGDSVNRDMKGAEGLSMPHALLNTWAANCCNGVLRLEKLPELEAMLQ